MTLAINTNSQTLIELKETHNGTIQLTAEYNHKYKPLRIHKITKQITSLF